MTGRRPQDRTGERLVNLEGVTSVAVTEADSALVLELVNTIQPSIPWTAEYLRWQFFETPAGHARLYGIKDAPGRLVALYASTAQKVCVGPQSVTGRMIQDVMTHPDFRGRGYLHHLADLCLQDMKGAGEVGYTFPNEKSEKSFRRNGWDELCAVPLRKRHCGRSPPATQMPDATPVDGDFDTTVTEIWDSSGLKVGVRRDADFLNWRYRKPSNKYFKFLLNANEGVLILKLYQHGQQRILHICDLLVREDRRGIISRTLEFCEQFGMLNKVDILTAWLCGEHPYAPQFDRFGLNLAAESSRFVFVFPGRVQFQDLKRPGLWHLSQGDSDVY